jgi:hypothetical protein
MSNKKLIVGIAAGVAALAVVGVICKRKGYFDGIIDRAGEFGEEFADKYQSVKETARKKIDEVVQKGGELADKAKSAASGASSSNGGSNDANTQSTF